MIFFNRSYLYFTYLIYNIAVLGLECYDCSSKDEVSTCGETLAEGHTLEPVNCEHIVGAHYCIKKTGLFEGKTKASTSALFVCFRGVLLTWVSSES